jgi:hypothetical protein
LGRHEPDWRNGCVRSWLNSCVGDYCGEIRSALLGWLDGGSKVVAAIPSFQTVLNSHGLMGSWRRQKLMGEIRIEQQTHLAGHLCV